MAGYEGWAEVNQEEMTIKDNSGHGGSQTFFVQAPESCVPSKVCLNTRSEDAHIIQRTVTAANAFECYNLGPRQLTFGTNYKIDEFQGIGTAKGDTPEMWAKMGALLARVHMIPTEWCDVYKAQCIDIEPVATMFPAGSLAWMYMHRGVWFSALPALSDDAKLDLATAVGTDHPIGGRIVTTHGDFHPGNVLDMGEDVEGDNRLKCIDFEFTCVTHAIHDISYGKNCFGRDVAKIRSFLTGYLQELNGNDVAEEEIQSLWIEAELATFGTWQSGGKLCPWDLSEKTEEEVMELVAEIKAFTSFVRGSEEA